MAFVYRTQQKQNRFGLQTPGPGSYLDKNHNKSHKQFIHSAPFNNSSNRELWKADLIPGPGAYTIQNTFKKQKKLLFQPTGQISVYQAPKQSVAFKSKTMRFAELQNKNIPGPGQYQVQITNNRNTTSQKKSRHSSSQLKNYLKQKNQIFRNNVKEEQIQKQMIISASENIDLIGQYQDNYQNFNKKSKNSIFFSSKVQRQFIKVRPQTSAGPGSYNIAKSAFQKEKKLQKRQPTKSICIQRKKQRQQHQEVGPGYYDVELAFKNLNKLSYSKKKKLQCFGSTVDRFTFSKGNTFGNYSSSDNLQKSKSQSKIKTMGCIFGKQQRRIFQSQKSPIGPGYYQTTNNFLNEKVSKQKVKSSKNKCYFGSTKQRFSQNNIVSDRKKQQSIKNIIGQVSYNFDNELKEAAKNKNNKTFKTLLKSRKRDYRSLVPNSSSDIKMKQNQNNDLQVPLCYDNQTHTLGFKYARKKQLNAPFLSGAQRFKQQITPKDILLVNQSKVSPKKQEQPTKQKTSPRKGLSKSKQIKVSGGFGSRDTRFKYKEQKNKQLGPQYYNASLVQKKSYNTLFNGVNNS